MSFPNSNNGNEFEIKASKRIALLQEQKPTLMNKIIFRTALVGIFWFGIKKLFFFNIPPGYIGVYRHNKYKERNFTVVQGPKYIPWKLPFASEILLIPQKERRLKHRFPLKSKEDALFEGVDGAEDDEIGIMPPTRARNMIEMKWRYIPTLEDVKELPIDGFGNTRQEIETVIIPSKAVTIVDNYFRQLPLEEIERNPLKHALAAQEFLKKQALEKEKLYFYGIKIELEI